MQEDHLVSWISLAVLSLSTVSAHASVTTQWINESKDYTVGERVGGWQVIEHKDAVEHNANNVWTANGVSGGDIDSSGNSILWFYYLGSSATVEFSQPSSSVGFMLQSDANDGLANFYVDNKGSLPPSL